MTPKNGKAIPPKIPRARDAPSTPTPFGWSEDNPNRCPQRLHASSELLAAAPQAGHFSTIDSTPDVKIPSAEAEGG